MLKTITIINFKGETFKMDLRKPEKSGFIVRSINGLGPQKAEVNVMEMSTMDGAIYGSSRLPMRNITLSLLYFCNDKSVEDIRLKSYRMFPIKKEIKMIVETDNRSAMIQGIVESNEPNIFSPNSGSDISIICPDPYFYSTRGGGVDTIYFSAIEPMFEFPFSNDSIIDNLLEFSKIRIETERLITVTGDVDVGMLMTIHAIGPVSGITVHNISYDEYMTIDTEIIESSTGQGLDVGDDIVVNTTRGKKRATLIRNGREYNILNSITRDSEWFQLRSGDNILAITTDSGELNMSVKIEIPILFNGV